MTTQNPITKPFYGELKQLKAAIKEICGKNGQSFIGTTIVRLPVYSVQDDGSIKTIMQNRRIMEIYTTKSGEPRIADDYGNYWRMSEIRDRETVEELLKTLTAATA